MGRLGCGGTLIHVRSGAVILSCAFAISLLFPSPSDALSLDPVVDTVLSVAKLSEPDDTVNRDNRRGSIRSEEKTAETPSSSNRTPAATIQPTSSVVTAPEPAVIVEPLEQLPSIDVSKELPLRTPRMYRPASTLSVSHAVLGAATTEHDTPLQASSHGWKVFGIRWYWWLLTGGLAGYGIRQLLLVRQQRIVDLG